MQTKENAVHLAIHDLWTQIQHGQTQRDKFIEFVVDNAHTLGAPDMVLSAIRMALENDAIIVARELARRGHEIFPDNDSLQKAGDTLAEPKIIDGESAVNDAKANYALAMKWIAENSRHYVGRWIAIKSGSLLGVADTRKQLVEKLDNATDLDTLIIRIP